MGFCSELVSLNMCLVACPAGLCVTQQLLKIQINERWTSLWSLYHKLNSSMTRHLWETSCLIFRGFRTSEGADKVNRWQNVHVCPIRSCVVGCWITECQFLAKGGASLLLDVLRASPRCVHGIILSTLLDLCSNPNARPQVLSWRDVGGQTAPRLLLQLWREEEEELGVLRNQRGGIKGLTRNQILTWENWRNFNNKLIIILSDRNVLPAVIQCCCGDVLQAFLQWFIENL